MGNRAYIKAAGSDDMALYLHWNGGIDSVTAFLKYCELQGFRGFGVDNGYAFARLAQVTTSFMSPEGLSVGIASGFDDRCDNGVYEVEGWKIVSHTAFGSRIDADEEDHEGYDLDGMLGAIDECQPENLRIGRALRGRDFPVADLSLGDRVLIKSYGAGGTRWRSFEVAGFGEEGLKMNGWRDYSGLPFVNRYGDHGVYRDNPNNYLTSETCIKVPDDAPGGDIFSIESDRVEGSPADDWRTFAESILKWCDEPMDESESSKMAEAFAARAVLMAGGRRSAVA